jgi:hypothetical protein
MEVNTARLADLVHELVLKTWRGDIRWKLQSDKSYQYEGPRAAVLITSAGDLGEGPYTLILRDSGGTDTGNLTEATTPDSDMTPASWNSSLAFLYSLARRRSSETAEDIMEDLGF